MSKMNILEILSHHNFPIKQSEIFLKYHEEFIHCVNEENQISLVIKEYDENNLLAINDDVMRVRAILRENNINIWNSYFLILLTASTSTVDSKIYHIERKPQGLRKYVILSKDDLYRIPFIEKSKDDNVSLNFSTNFDEFLETDDLEVKKFLEWMINNNGEYVEIKKSEIKENINKLIEG